MKKKRLNKTSWKSTISAIIFGVFVWFALGSINTTAFLYSIFYNETLEKRTSLGDSKFEVVEQHIDYTKITTGKQDNIEWWQGKVTITMKSYPEMEIISTEEVNMVDDRRHGISTKTYADGHVETTCYNKGQVVDCESQIAPTVNKESASDILSTKNPETLNELEVKSGFDAAQIKAMLDTMQNMMFAVTFDFNNFDTVYQDIQEELLSTKYDSIVAANAELSFYQGIQLSKFDEFRIAVINRYLRGDNSLFNSIKQVHSNYLHLLNNYGYSDIDVENFCNDFDRLMTSDGLLDVNSPYLVDSIEKRMVRVLLQMTGYDILYGLKSLNLDNQNLSVSSFLKSQYDRAKTPGVAATPRQVAQLVVGLVYYHYIEGDKIRKALMESYAYQKGIVLFPIVTTVFQNRNSSSGVTVSGNVIDDGGGEIITQGFVWGTFYNPNYRDNVIAEDPGTGLFQSEINGLVEGVTYYVRSFATNSAGTQYGNCVEFTTNLSVSTDMNELNNPELNIYPNPTSGVTNFRFNVNTTEKITLSIINLKGQIVAQKELSGKISGENLIGINLSNLENGIYTGRLTIDNSKQLNRQFMIAH